MINKGMSHLPGMLITTVLRNDPGEHHRYEGHFFMFVESGCISTNIEFTVP